VTSEGTDAVTSVRSVGPAATGGRTAHVSRVARPRCAHGAAPFSPSMPPRDHGTRRPHPTPHPLRRLLLCPPCGSRTCYSQHTTTQVFSFRTKIDRPKIQDACSGTIHSLFLQAVRPTVPATHFAYGENRETEILLAVFNPWVGMLPYYDQPAANRG
jgi:hypothetical protein